MTKKTIWKKLLVSAACAVVLLLAGCNLSFGVGKDDEDLPALTGRVYINGDAKPGKELTVDTGELQGEGTVSLYWLRTSSEKTVEVGMGPTYIVKSTDVDMQISVRASRAGHSGFIYSEPKVPTPPAITKEYTEGDTGPGGGKIFYRDLEGFALTNANSSTRIAHYLEFAHDCFSDSFKNIQWQSNGYTDIKGTNRGSQENSVLKSIEGRRNTILILSILDDQAPAAYVAANYQGVADDGKIFSDWFLPSITGLEHIHKCQALDDGVYWSSSQYDLKNAWALEIKEGTPKRVDKPKSEQHSILPVRAF